jgi:hypothetical protein
MTEIDWRRLEQRLAGDHAAADPPLSPAVWSRVDARIAAARAGRPPRRRAWLAAAAAATAVLVAGVAALWLVRPAPVEVAAVPAPRPAPTVTPAPAPAPPAPPPATPPRPPSIVLNQVIEPRAQVTVAITADAGRIEIEPCRGRFVNVTVLDSSHRSLALVERDRRVELRFDRGPVMADGVAHVLVPADTHLVIATRSGAVVVRGLGGPIEIDSASGEIQVDTAPALDPSAVLHSDSGPIRWQGRCGRRCRVEATSRAGDIALRAPDPAVFTRGAVRGDSRSGRVHLEQLTCTDPRCSSSPLPWRADGPGHGAP